MTVPSFVTNAYLDRLGEVHGADLTIILVDATQTPTKAMVTVDQITAEVTGGAESRTEALGAIEAVGDTKEASLVDALGDPVVPTVDASGVAEIVGWWVAVGTLGVTADAAMELVSFNRVVTGPGTTPWSVETEVAGQVFARVANDVPTTTATAASVSVDATGFAGNLSGTDTDVQTALDTIDALTLGTGGTGIGPVFVYNSSGSTSGNRYASWSTLMADVATIDGPKIIQFEQNETITASGMPGGGWDLNGATLMGVNALAGRTVFVTFSEGVKLVGWGSVAVSTGCILYSKSSTPVWEISDHASHEFRDSGAVMAETCEFIRCTEGVGDVVEFRFFNGSGFVRPDTWGPLFAGDGSYEALAANGSGDVALKDTAGSSALQNNTVRGAGVVYRLVYNGAKPASYPAATGDTQTNASDFRIDLLSVADRHAYDNGTSGLAATNVQDAIDELATSGGGSGDVVGPASSTDDHVALFDGTTGKLIKDGGPVTAAGLALLDDADATAQRATLGTGGILAGQDEKTGPANTTTETSLLTSAPTVTATAGEVLRIVAAGTYVQNSGNSSTPTIRLKLAGTTVLSWSQIFQNSATVREWEITATLRVQANGDVNGSGTMIALNALMPCDSGTSSAAIQSGVTLDLTWQHGSATSTQTVDLAYYFVERIRAI